MRSQLRKVVRTLLRVPEKVDIAFYLQNLFWKHVLGVNRKVPWPIHFTSRVAAPEKVQLGRCSYPGDMPGCYIQAINGIIIGDECIFGPGVGLISANHDPEDYDRHVPAPPIRIGNYCWVGMHAVILPGVELGDHTIVGAGSVVTQSFPEGHCVLAGNPARVIKRLPLSAPLSYSDNAG